MSQRYFLYTLLICGERFYQSQGGDEFLSHMARQVNGVELSVFQAKPVVFLGIPAQELTPEKVGIGNPKPGKNSFKKTSKHYSMCFFFETSGVFFESTYPKKEFNDLFLDCVPIPSPTVLFCLREYAHEMSHEGHQHTSTLPETDG